jgi:hypothetical protein
MVWLRLSCCMGFISGSMNHCALFNMDILPCTHRGPSQLLGVGGQCSACEGCF